MKKDIYLGKSPGYAKHTRNEGGRSKVNRRVRRTAKKAIRGENNILQ